MARLGAYDPWSAIPNHDHNWAFIALVADGVVHELCDGHRDIRTRGAVRIMPAGTPHANRYRAEGARCLITELHGEAADLASAARGVLDIPAVHQPGTRVSVLAMRMYSEYLHGDDLTPLALDGLLRELLAAAGRTAHGRTADDAAPRWVLRVRDRIHDTFPSAPSLRQLAGEAGVHPGHLVRVFRRTFQCAPGQYIARLRIETARAALEATTQPIATIALSVGFTDQAHFTRRFKALVGTTPARYRMGCAVPFRGGRR